MKAHQNMTLKELRDYVRTKKLNKIVQLTMNKPALIEGLKKIDHWEDVEKKKRTRPGKGVLQIGKKPDKPARIDTSNKNKGMVLKSQPKKETPKKKAPKKKAPKKIAPKKPRGLKIRSYEDGEYGKITEIIYSVGGIDIKLYHNYYHKEEKDELYLETFNNENTSGLKKGTARKVLYDTVNWLVHNKIVSVSNSFKLHAKSPIGEGYSQSKLNTMYEKMGFKRHGGIDDKPKYSMNVGEYLEKNK